MRHPPKPLEKEMRALKRAIAIAGSQSALARIIGVNQQNVNHWLLKGSRVPAEYVIPIERASYGQVKRHELRPDLYPIEDYRFLNERRVDEHSLS